MVIEWFPDLHWDQSEMKDLARARARYYVEQIDALGWSKDRIISRLVDCYASLEIELPENKNYLDDPENAG